MTTRAGANRFNTQGRDVEKVSFVASVLEGSDTVYITIEGEKRVQTFYMARWQWNHLISVKPNER